MLHGAGKAHETAAQPRHDAAAHQRHGRAEATWHKDEEQHIDGHHRREGHRRQIRHDQDRHQRDEREDREQPLLAVAVGQVADDLRSEERGESAREVKPRQFGFEDAGVGHRVRRDEWHDEEHAHHQRQHESKGAEVIGHAQQRPQLAHRVMGLHVAQVGVERRQDAPGEGRQQQRQRRQREERRAPRKMRGQPQPQRHAHDCGQRERRGDDRRAARASCVGHHVRHDRQHQCADHAAEHARDDAGRQQQRIRSRQSAQRRGDDEAAEHHEERALARHPVDPEHGDEAAGRSRECIGRNEEPEVLRIEFEDAHQVRPQRHDDHEVEDVDELHRRQRQEQQEFARRRRRFGHARRRGAGQWSGQEWKQ